jgi:type I restriction enzyme R subunit
MKSLPPWVDDPFERLVHAEGHYHGKEDFDRRAALIGFDNTIEVALKTYLSLHPTQRGNRTYQKADVEKWARSYNGLLEFLEAELAARGEPWKVEQTYVLWVHQARNEHYHGGGRAGVPERKVLMHARTAAVWIVGLLFDLPDLELHLDEAVRTPQPEDAGDEAADDKALERRLEIDADLLPKSAGVESAVTESLVEEAALRWLEMLGYEVKGGAAIAPGESEGERAAYDQVVLEGRLRAALSRLNPSLPPAALDEAFRKLTRISSPSLVEANRQLHRYLVQGVDVEYVKPGGGLGYAPVRVIDFEDPGAGDWLAVNQLTVRERGHSRRADVVVYLNGLPLALFELKNAVDEKATVWKAYEQLQTYKNEIPVLFTYNEVLVISDGLDARLGSLTASRERFMPWRTIKGEELALPSLTRLEVLLRGVFEKRRFLDLLKYFIVFEADGARLSKKVAGYHQFHAVNMAVDETVRAASTPALGGEVKEAQGRYWTGPQGHEGRPGDQRVGVVWHTQGSGKSLTMAFYAGRVVLHPEMSNPTLVVITDRNDLDDQLFGTFSRCQDLLRQSPQQATDREHLRELLQVASGGVVFTTIQKFLPEKKGDTHPRLSDRRNVVVIADEAHRSQYDFIKGFARHLHDALPNASYIGFTGTPLELADKDTRGVFGDYVSVYDIRRAVQDKVTVPIFYESRLARIELDPRERPTVDPEFEEVTEGEEVEGKEKLKTKWSALEALVGAERRIELVAADLVRHFESRLEAMDGKAMVVCMSRRICVELYDELVALRPSWHHDDDAQGALKVVMTGGASDPEGWQRHVRTKGRRETLATRFRDAEDPFKVVIVRDMWLTGFDAPCLHTMYLDKPMRGHGLMQAIARVNRVFRDKPGGLVVDYLGLAHQLQQALRTYTESGGEGTPKFDQEKAVEEMQERYEISRGILHGFDWSAWTSDSPHERLSLLPAAQEHVLAQEDGKARFDAAVRALSRSFALAVPHEKALAIRDDVGFFQAVRAALAKTTVSERKSSGDMDHAIRQIVSRAVSSGEVVDIFSAAGLKKPDISILSEEFLAEVRGMEHKSLGVEVLRKLLHEEVKRRERRNLVQSRSFAELLERSIVRYQNRAVAAAQVIEELIAMARELREADRRNEDLGLSEEEVAFYDALETNDSAVSVLGDETLKTIARELVGEVRRNVTIDWTVKESARAKLRVLVRRILRRHGYPPDKQESATKTVLEQAELLGEEWASG